MSEEAMRPDPPLRDEAHARAKEALTDAFFWDAEDPTGPFGNDTALEAFEELRDFLDEDAKRSPIALLDELLERWEIENAGWDVVAEDEVQELGENDELGLLVRDEALLALAFGELVIRGRVDPELRRRAMVALTRQALPALLHGFGERMKKRETAVARMREVLAKKWD